jgi:hypothetical protein
MRSTRIWLLALAFAAFTAGPVHANNFVVNDTTSDPDDDLPADDALCETAAGTCSLRAAIEEANERTGPHMITFAPAVQLITLTADLPDIRAQVTIDGTNAGAPGGRVDIDGTAVNGAGGFDCIDLISTGTVQNMPYVINNPNGGQGSTITNLVLRNCSDNGITASGHGYSFTNNRIGTNAIGTQANKNDGDGIDLSGTIPPPALPPDISAIIDDPLANYAAIAAFAASLQGALTVIAQPNFITGNLISGNDQHAIELNNPMTTNTFVAGNIVGLNAAASAALPNGTGGGSPAAIDVNAGAYGNIIGPGNIISGNTNDGIIVSGAVILPNFIMGNLIGVGSAPALELGNGNHGIELDSTRDTDSSGMNNPANPTPYSAFIGPANIISDNKSDNGGGALDVYGSDDSGGISVDGEGVRIFGNAIGMWAFPAGVDLSAIGIQDPLIDVGNSGNGIVLNTSGHQVGGAEPFEANFILHNGRHGILVKGSGTSGNKIQGNFIGVAPVGIAVADLFSLGNRGNGIVVHAASSTLIGGTDPDEDNVIAGNGINGIALRQGAVTNGWSNLIRRNQIYANAQTNPMVGIAVDLEHDINVADVQPDPAGQDPNTLYANYGQNQPTICTGNNTPLPGCTAASFNAGTGATSTKWTLPLARANTMLRIEYFALRATGMTFLYDETVMTDAAGLPTGGSCVLGFCTSTGTPGSPVDTRGQSIVMTATDLFQTDVPPVGMGPMNDPANNTSEYSLGAPIPQEIAFSSATYTAGEAAGTTLVTVRRLGNPAGTVSIDVIVAAAPGTATGGGTDYGLVTVNPVTWADGDSADKTFTISINNDLLDEADETVNLELANPVGAVEAALNAATLTITDNDLPPTLAIADNGATEGSAVQFTATLSAASSFDVVITYSTADASAVQPGDYTQATNLSATILAGNLTTNFSVATAGDSIDENDETFLVNATATNTTVAGSDLQAVGTIQDDDLPPMVSIGDVGPLAEGNGPGITPFGFTVSINTASGLPVTVRATSGDPGDTALAPSDYAVVNQLVTIPAGSLSAPLTVNVVGDTTFEPAATEVFTITIAPDAVQPVNASIADGTATGTITNDDASPGTLQFSTNPADQTVAENVGTTNFIVSRTGGSAGAVSTTVTLGGTATLGAGNDYTTSSLVLNWADGDAADKIVTVTVNDDVGQEAAETVTLTLGTFTGGATGGVPLLATLTISANDAPAGSLQFTANPDQSVAENVGTATFTVTRTGGTAGAVGTTVTLGGTATLGAGNDYTTTSLNLAWADGDATDRTITVTVNDDVAPEADETVTFTLGAPTGGAALGAPSVATLTILANDASPGTLQFSTNPADQTVAENVGTTNFIVSRTGGSAGAVSTTVTLGGSATLGAGNDYTTSSLVLNWADGDVANKIVTVTVNDDVAPEAAETVTLTLGTFTGGAVGGVPVLATLTISANDAAAGSLQFTPNPADQTVAETVGTATFTVSRTGGSAGAVGATVVLGGTAMLGAGNDYTTTALALAWADGDPTNRTITVTVNNDAAPEANETVVLTLSAPTGGAVLGTPAAATLTITANDQAAGSVQFATALANQSIGEGGGTATFTFSRTGGTAGAISVTIALGGSATSPADYGNTSTTLAWADGDGADKTLVFTIVDDAAPEADETVTLAIGNAGGGAVVGAPGSATLTIVDNDGVVVPAATPITIPATSPWMLLVLAALMLALAGAAHAGLRRH